MTAEPLTPEEEAMLAAITGYWRERYGEGDPSADSANPLNVAAARRMSADYLATLDAARKASRGSGLDVDAVLPPLPADAYVSEQFRAGWLAARAALAAARKASPPLDVERLERAIIQTDVRWAIPRDLWREAAELIADAYAALDPTP